MFRLITFASAHPRITEGQTLSTREIVDLLLHGISAGRTPAEKTASEESTRRTDSPVGDDHSDYKDDANYKHDSSYKDDQSHFQPDREPTHAQPIGAR